MAAHVSFVCLDEEITYLSDRSPSAALKLHYSAHHSRYELHLEEFALPGSTKTGLFFFLSVTSVISTLDSSTDLAPIANMADRFSIFHANNFFFDLRSS